MQMITDRLKQKNKQTNKQTNKKKKKKHTKISYKHEKVHLVFSVNVWKH